MSFITNLFSSFNIKEFASAFVVLFAIIDITGSIPIILNLKKKGKNINNIKAVVLSFIIFMIFFYVGEAFLGLFGVDISSFAAAGSILIFIIALEMLLDIEIFKTSENAPKDATVVPIVFPLIAGAGAVTTILSIRAQYSDINIILAMIVNLVFVYVVLRATKQIEKILGPGTIYMLQKFFGIIILTMALKLFTTNIAYLIHSLKWPA